jgi:hypothetical protein
MGFNDAQGWIDEAGSTRLDRYRLSVAIAQGGGATVVPAARWAMAL